MASQYNVEPQPTAKVILNTTAGDLTIELFAKQIPLASRNFLQHCIDGYYINNIFHRLVPGFIIQAGDPTGTGSGGISAINNGDPFEDEFHSRLKFNRRGLLGMANEGTNANTSQFFFTLGATPELQGKNTMFGRIEGDTIYNLIKMSEVELADGTERPLYPVRITGAEILVNPFTDMVARARVVPTTKSEDAGKDTKKRKKPAGKNVLSFVDDEEDGVVVPVTKKSKANLKLVQIAEEKDADTHKVTVPKARKQTEAQSQAPKCVSAPIVALEPAINANKSTVEVDIASDEEEEDDITALEARRQVALDKTNAEIEALKASMKRSSKSSEKVSDHPVSAFKAMVPSATIKGRKRGKARDEAANLNMFNAFKSRLENVNTYDNVRTTHSLVDSLVEKPVDAADEGDGEAALCDLHFIANCQSCKAWDENPAEDDEDGDDLAWMSHQLTFAKDTLGKDLEWKKKMDEIEVIDPREKAKTIVGRDHKPGKKR